MSKQILTCLCHIENENTVHRGRPLYHLLAYFSKKKSNIYSKKIARTKIIRAAPACFCGRQFNTSLASRGQLSPSGKNERSVLFLFLPAHFVSFIVAGRVWAIATYAVKFAFFPHIQHRIKHLRFFFLPYHFFPLLSFSP